MKMLTRVRVSDIDIANDKVVLHGDLMEVFDMAVSDTTENVFLVFEDGTMNSFDPDQMFMVERPADSRALSALAKEGI